MKEKLDNLGQKKVTGNLPPCVPCYIQTGPEGCLSLFPTALLKCSDNFPLKQYILFQAM